MKTTRKTRVLLFALGAFAIALLCAAVAGVFTVSHAQAIFRERLYVEPWPYWKVVLGGGPIFLALHIAIALVFPCALIASISRASAVVTTAFCLAPFVLGATAMWVSSIGLIAVATNLNRCGSINPLVVEVPMPFHLGTFLSAIAFATFGLANALRGRA